jgi:hypothetical protein
MLFVSLGKLTRIFTHFRVNLGLNPRNITESTIPVVEVLRRIRCANMYRPLQERDMRRNRSVVLLECSPLLRLNNGRDSPIEPMATSLQILGLSDYHIFFYGSEIVFETRSNLVSAVAITQRGGALTAYVALA